MKKQKKEISANQMITGGTAMKIMADTVFNKETGKTYSRKGLETLQKKGFKITGLKRQSKLGVAVGTAGIAIGAYGVIKNYFGSHHKSFGEKVADHIISGTAGILAGVLSVKLGHSGAKGLSKAVSAIKRMKSAPKVMKAASDSAKSGGVKFIRMNGRIIPIKAK